MMDPRDARSHAALARRREARLSRTLRLLSLLVLCAYGPPALAQDVRDAEVLPRGVGVFLLGSGLTFGLDRFGPKASFGRESVLTDFDQLDLTALIAGPDAPLVETVIGSLGVTNFAADQKTFFFDFTVGYGITDRLTVAARMPLQISRYSVDAWLTPKDNQAEVRVLGESFTCPGGNFDVADVADLSKLLVDTPGYRFNIGDLNRALISPCLGYKSPFDSISISPEDQLFHGRSQRSYVGFRDLALAAKYKLLHTEHLGLSAMLWIVAPTGAVDDPDDFFDPKFGDGQWDVAGIAAATLPYDALKLHFAAGYEIQLPDQILLRLWDLGFSEQLETDLAEGRLTEEQLFDGHLDDGQIIPVVPGYDRSVVSRDLGDNIYLYSAAVYELNDWLAVSIAVDYLLHMRDRITDAGRHVADNQPFSTESEIRAEVERQIAAGELREEDRVAELRARLGASAGRKAAAYAWHTIRQQLTAGIGLTATTVEQFLRGDFPLPLIASIGATIYLFGQNIDTDDTIQISVAVPFAFGDVRDPSEYGYDDVEGQGLPWP